jgi:hypothetical protein
LLLVALGSDATLIIASYNNPKLNHGL